MWENGGLTIILICSWTDFVIIYFLVIRLIILCLWSTRVVIVMQNDCFEIALLFEICRSLLRHHCLIQFKKLLLGDFCLLFVWYAHLRYYCRYHCICWHESCNISFITAETPLSHTILHNILAWQYLHQERVTRIEWVDMIQVSAAAHVGISGLRCRHHWQSRFQQQRRQVWGSHTLTDGMSYNSFTPDFHWIVSLSVVSDATDILMNMLK